MAVTLLRGGMTGRRAHWQGPAKARKESWSGSFPERGSLLSASSLDSLPGPSILYVLNKRQLLLIFIGKAHTTATQ